MWTLLTAFSIFLVTNAANVPPGKQSPLLLVLSFDGLGPDMLNEVLTPNLWKLAQEGAWSPRGAKCQVATYTAPNYYSIATGLTEEHHGIIGNSFYDPNFKEKYDYWNFDDMIVNERSREAKWYSGETIWQTHQKQGFNAGGMRWPLCEIRVPNNMSRCAQWRKLGDVASWKKDADDLLSWFTASQKPINLGFFYIQDPDTIEHANDIFSPKVKAKLTELDSIVEYLVKKLKSAGLYDRMNIIFIADHGHSNVYGANNVINIDEIIDTNDYIWSAKSIFPNPERGVKVEDLYKKLELGRKKFPRFSVWLKEEFPDQYHYKNNTRIGPIILIEKLGYLFNSTQFNATHEKPPPLPIYGKHGFLNDYYEMRPAFFVTGPAFKRNLTIDWEIENIDLYNLMAAVLGLKPAKTDGNFSRVYPLLEKVCAGSS